MIYVIAALFFVLWAVAVVRLDIWRQWHHEYIGVAMVLIPWAPCQWVGLLVMADDTWQHTRQLSVPTYLSPLHRLWDWTVAHG